MIRRFATYASLGILAAIIVAPNLLKPAVAAGSTGGDVNSIDQKVDELNTIRDDSSLSASDKAAKEFRAQEDILNGVTGLSDNEIASAKDKLGKLPDFDQDSPEQKLRDNYLTELGTYSAYFDAEKQKIKEATSLDDLKTIASDLKAYRAGGYNDELQNMVTFTLLYYADEITATARTRLDKITSDIAKLQDAGFLKKGFAQNSLSKADGLIKDAVKLHDQAEIMILRPVQEQTTGDKANPTMDTGTDKKATPPPTARDLIEKSISDIKSAYNIFLQVGKDARKALGLK